MSIEDKESVSYFSQFISVKVKKVLRKSQAQLREKLRTLRLRQDDGCLLKKLPMFRILVGGCIMKISPEILLASFLPCLSVCYLPSI